MLLTVVRHLWIIAKIWYPGIEPGSPALQVDYLPTELSRKPPPPPRPGIKGSLLLNKKSSSVYQILSIGSDKAVVPNIFGTRDRFHGRQFFDGWGRWREGSGSNVNNGEWPLKLAHPPLTSCYAAEFLKGS